MILSDEHHRAIGRISVNFSDVEAWAGFFIWQLVGPDQLVGQIVTAEMSFSRKLDLLSSLFRHRFKDETLREKLSKLVGRLANLEQRRNTTLHSSWLHQSIDRTEATRLKITAKRKKGLQQAKQVIKPAELDALADEMAKAVAEIGNLMIPLVADLW
jgi:hypothetical protein